VKKGFLMTGGRGTIMGESSGKTSIGEKGLSNSSYERASKKEIVYYHRRNLFTPGSENLVAS